AVPAVNAHRFDVSTFFVVYEVPTPCQRQVRRVPFRNSPGQGVSAETNPPCNSRRVGPFGSKKNPRFSATGVSKRSPTSRPCHETVGGPTMGAIRAATSAARADSPDHFPPEIGRDRENRRSPRRVRLPLPSRARRRRREKSHRRSAGAAAP